jgi:hypothetical protein
VLTYCVLTKIFLTFELNEFLRKVSLMEIEEALVKNWWVYPGFELELVASGLDLPVNLAFVPYPSDDPKAPLLYVTELYGQIKVLTNDWTMHTYATGLLNYGPSHEFPGTGESGLIGICVEPETGDLFLSLLYMEEGTIKGRVVRTSSKDGLKMESMEVIIDSFPLYEQGTSSPSGNRRIRWKALRERC